MFWLFYLSYSHYIVFQNIHFENKAQLGFFFYYLKSSLYLAFMSLITWGLIKTPKSPGFSSSVKGTFKNPSYFPHNFIWTAFMSLKLNSSLPPVLTLPLCNLSAFIMAQMRLTFPVNHILQDRCGISSVNDMLSPKPDHRQFSVTSWV